MLKIKQYGIERSGTNYLRQLLEDNVIDVIVYVNKLGWKHGAVKCKDSNITKKDNIHPIIIIKNPYSWYQSIKNYRKKKPFDFKREFKRYNKLYSLYKDLYENGHDVYTEAYILKYEDLLKNPKKELIKIVNALGGELKSNFINPTKVNMSKKFTKDRKNFYLDGGNFGLPSNIIKDITEIIDWQLMKFYGYHKI